MTAIAGIPSLSELKVDGRRVLVRVDFNVPLDGERVIDDTRIRAVLPTIEYLTERDCRIVLASHLGRPKSGAPGLSMEPVALRLAELLPQGEVRLADDCDGDSARKVVADLRDGQVALLENLRLNPGEEANDEGFARSLARLGDVYVNDAFGVSHRAHASVAALPRLFEERGAGPLLEREVQALSRLLHDAEHPYVAILGGAKVSDKIALLDRLLQQVDALLIGGAMANTFLAAKGNDVGKSRIEADKLSVARNILQKAANKGVRVHLPIDVVVAPSLDANVGTVTAVEGIGADQMALDIGPQTVADFATALQSAKTVFWNGPMGLFEKSAFAQGTFGVARAAAECHGYTVIGGGDSVAAVHQANLIDRFSHVSTGGGASLEFLEGRKLPGIEALRR